MNRYEQLTVKAAAYSIAFNTNRERCQMLAKTVALELQAFLGSPTGAIRFAPLDINLKSDLRTEAITTLPSMTYKNDGRWHVGIRIHLPNSKYNHLGQITLKFSIKLVNNRFILFSCEKEYEINSDDLETLKPVFSAIYEELCEDYSKSPDKPTTMIGLR